MINEAPAVLEDDDVLEMVNAGLAPITVVDDYLAEFWSQVFTAIKVRRDLSVRTGGKLAVAFRKDSPNSKRLSTSGCASTERATHSETCSSNGICRTSST